MKLFQGTKIAGIGRFRAKNELITIDINKNRFDGSLPHDINEELGTLWAHIENPLRTIASRQDFRDFVADFLPRFFRIHPFLDGNGRVGRAFVRIVGLSVGFDFLDHKKHRALYVRSLRYTHRFYKDEYLVRERQKGSARHFDYLWLFKMYVEKQIHEELGDDVTEQEP